MLYVLTENWLVYLVGCALGIAAAIGFNILLSQYIDLSKPDVILCLVAISIMFIASTIATWLPAKRTSAIPPVVATRTV
jgi:putative ABC transport system permease protein